MEISPSKCGVMEINTDAYCPRGRPLNYNGQDLPDVEKYVYLGTEINNELNFNELAKFRLTKGRSTVAQIKNTLANETVPLEYRRMLISNILVPRIMFGSEIFGMSEKRVHPLKRTYNECYIELPYITSAVSRVRGILK